MKISEFIKRLEKAMKEHGDIEVYLHDGYDDGIAETEERFTDPTIREQVLKCHPSRYVDYNYAVPIELENEEDLQDFIVVQKKGWA